MSRFVSAGLAAIAVASLAACTEAPVAPQKDLGTPTIALSNSAAGADEQVVPGEVLVKFKNNVNAEAKANAQAQQLAKQRINAAQSAWYAFDRAKAEEHTPEALDATRKSAKRLEEGLPPAFAEKIAAYNAAQYEKRLAALGR